MSATDEYQICQFTQGTSKLLLSHAGQLLHFVEIILNTKSTYDKNIFSNY